MTTDSDVQQRRPENAISLDNGHPPNEQATQRRRRRRNYFQDDEIRDIVNYP